MSRKKKVPDIEINPTGFRWRPTLLFGTLKWELLLNHNHVGWIVEMVSNGPGTVWCAFDGRGNGLVKPLVHRGNISDCAKALISKVK